MNTKYTFTLIAAVCASTAFAAKPIDFGEITPGTVYTYESKTPAGGYFTPAESCVVKTYATGDMIHAYSDANHTQEVASTNYYYGANGEKVNVYNGIGGETIYFYNDFPFDGGTFRLAAGNEEITLSHAYPAPSDKLMSVADNYRLELIFSTPVKCTKCKLEAGGQSIDLTPDIYSSTVTFDWHSIIMQWYADGTLSEGDEMTMTITGIRDENDSGNRPNFGDGAGKLILRYKMAAKPAQLVDQTNTPNSGCKDFMTYYLPGGEDGLVKLTFDRDLDPTWKPTAKIQYGDLDNQDYSMYIEYPPVFIEGSTLNVDLRGVSRLPGEMVPGLPAQKYIYLQVTDIKSSDGQHVWTGQLSSPYSFGFSYELKTVIYNVAADWLPLPGAPLASGTDMEIWVLNGNHIIFDTVDFAFTHAGEPAMASVPYSELQAEADPSYADAVIYTLKAPQLDADADTEINVSFGGLICADGQDHTSDISVRYRSATSGVESVTVGVADDTIYDLQGRRVTNPSAGIYIRGGKKFIVK